MMRKYLCIFLAALSLLGSLDPALSSWAVKKLVGSQWRNGNRLLSQALGRKHTEIKSIIASMPPVYQDHYKQIAERYADSLEAKEKATTPAAVQALDEHMAYLKSQAQLLLGGALGGGQQPQQQQQQQQGGGAPAGGAAAAGKGGGVADAVLDPLQQQLLQLQSRQQQQMKQLIESLQQAQQEERLKLEHQLREARAQHLAVQGEANSIRSIFIRIQSTIKQIQTNISDLTQFDSVIETLTDRMETALARAAAQQQAEQQQQQQQGEGEGAAAPAGAGSVDPRELQALDGNVYVETKARMSMLLGHLNRELQRVAGEIGKAEARASNLADLGPTGRQVSEQLLQVCASFRVSLSSQEEYLREVVGGLEKKQIKCDFTLNKLRAALEAAYARHAGDLRARVAEQQQQIAAAAASLTAAVAAGAQQIKQQIDAALQQDSSVPRPPHAAQQRLQQLQQLAATWGSNLDQSLMAFEQKLDAAAALAAAAAALPKAHAVDLSQLQQASQQAQEAKRNVRQHRAQVQHKLRILSSLYEQQQLQQQQQQQQALQQTGIPNADPYAQYAFPVHFPSGAFEQNPGGPPKGPTGGPPTGLPGGPLGGGPSWGGP